MQDYSIDLTKTVKTIIPAMKNGMDSTASNFSGTSAPTAQFVGQQYYNSTDKIMYTCTDVENNTWTNLLGDANVYYLDSDGCLCEKMFVEVTE